MQNTQQAKRYVRLIVILTQGIALLVMLLLYYGRVSVIQIFTNDPEVQAMSVDCLYLIVMVFFFDCLQGTL